ncbi:MAG: nucleotidyl transferase AbiEii/AbiGii toxin family protein [Flavobacteriales bacterium]|nr:nucleotidyl transferase AbiEii/AbiGii toxin family protein [Flavobacteriales bacterium]
MSLSTKAVNEKLIDLTRKLQSIELLRSHRLVGGTNLALRFNHRLSIDIDLFCDTTPDIHLAKAIESEIKNLFQSKDVTVTSVKSIGVFLVIKGIKVDIVNYRMNWLNQSELVSGINVASLEDIIAMKLETITDRGSRKDFYDIHLF